MENYIKEAAAILEALEADPEALKRYEDLTVEELLEDLKEGRRDKYADILCPCRPVGRAGAL